MSPLASLAAQEVRELVTDEQLLQFGSVLGEAASIKVGGLEGGRQAILHALLGRW